MQRLGAYTGLPFFFTHIHYRHIHQIVTWCDKGIVILPLTCASYLSKMLKWMTNIYTFAPGNVHKHDIGMFDILSVARHVSVTCT